MITVCNSRNFESFLRFCSWRAALRPEFTQPGSSLPQETRPIASYLADDPTLVERSAAAELVHYLTRSTGADFQIVAGERSPGGGSAGNLLSVQPTAWPSWECRHRSAAGRVLAYIRTRDQDLLLFGGGVRGTMYCGAALSRRSPRGALVDAVRRTCPASAGVSVRRNSIERGAPRLRYRELTGTGPRWEFHLRHRLNGHRSWIPPSHGGREGYGLPGTCAHGLQLCFAREVFRRTSRSTSLCSMENVARRKDSSA